MHLPSILYTISSRLQTHNAKAIVVGGSVRDYFMGLPIKDYDIEVYGLDTLERLEAILSRYGKVKLVGKCFGVLKFVYKGHEYDFAFPRTERKTARGHRGFAVRVDGMMDFENAARRRDFTVNAMGYDILQKRFLDPFGGRKDLERKILRYVDKKSFIEDPLRFYRGVQFCARFGLKMDSRTKRLCRQMAEEGMLEELPKERVFAEIRKLLLQAEKPSVGFVLIKELGALRYFPPLDTLCVKRWEETLRRLDLTAQMQTESDFEKVVLMLTSLVLSFENERQIENFIRLLSDEIKLRSSIIPLWKYYHEVEEIYRSTQSDALIRKLSVKVSVPEVVKVAKAAYLATTKKQKEGYRAGEWLLKKAEKLGVLHAPPPPLLQGRDLVAHLGLSPSPKFKEILDKVYEAQLEGRIGSKEEALHFVKKGVL